MSITIYMLAFCRIVIGLVFLVSSLGKVRHFAEFKRTVLSFQLLPEKFCGLAALLFLCAEFAVTGLVTLGGNLLLAGFLLAFVLLLIFSAALASVLVKRLQTTCNCFGPNKKVVSITDVWRNLGFILCALGGCIMFAWVRVRSITGGLGTLEWLLMCMCACIFVLLCTHLEEIMQLLHQN